MQDGNKNIIGFKEKMSLYEILYGTPYQTATIPGKNHVIDNHNLRLYDISLGKTLLSLRSFVGLASLVNLDVQVHPHQL